MKLFSLAGVAILIIASTSVNAQTNRVNSSGVTNASETNEVTSANANAVSQKAKRDFTGNNKNASNIQWETLSTGGNMVYFTDGTVKGKSVYNKRGVWQYTLRYLGASDVDRETRNLVRSTYVEFEINGAIEVEQYNMKVLLVYLENETGYKTIRITNEGMETVQEFVKSK